MGHLIVWALTGLVAGGWSLACWALLHLLDGADWAPGHPGAWLAWLEQWRIPVWLAESLPMAAITALKAWLTAWGPWLESWISQAPQLLAWLAPLVWLGWAMGLLVLAMFGAAGSVLVVALRARPEA